MPNICLHVRVGPRHRQHRADGRSDAESHGREDENVGRDLPSVAVTRVRDLKHGGCYAGEEGR